MTVFNCFLCSKWSYFIKINYLLHNVLCHDGYFNKSILDLDLYSKKTKMLQWIEPEIGADSTVTSICSILVAITFENSILPFTIGVKYRILHIYPLGC